MYQSLNLGNVNVHVPVLEGIELAGKHGFQGVAVGPDQAAEIGKEKVRELLKRWNLHCSAFAIPQAYDSPDKAEFEKGGELLKAQAETASYLGCKGAIMWIMPFHETMNYEQRFEFLAERLGAYGRILKDFGIALGLEFIGPEKVRKGKPFEFAYNIPQMLELCRAVGTGTCGLLLDAHHCYAAGHDMKDVYNLKKEEIVLVHVNDAVPGVAREDVPDSPRALPGETGVIDIHTFMDGLKTIGYEGPVEAEPFSQKLAAMSDPDEILDVVKGSLDQIWPK